MHFFNPLFYLVVFLVLLYFPVAIFQLILIIKGWTKGEDRLFTRLKWQESEMCLKNFYENLGFSLKIR